MTEEMFQSAARTRDIVDQGGTGLETQDVRGSCQPLPVPAVGFSD